MSDADATVPAGPQPLIERIWAWCHTTAMMAAAEIGLFDRLAAGPRTEAEYAALLERAGFRLTRVMPSPTPMCVIEAVPV